MSDEPIKTVDSLIGIKVDNGRYEIVKLIGQGGMGRVFQARQVSMNRMVALKLLRAQLSTDPQLLARFQQEAQGVSKLRHPNTITMFDYGKTEDGYLFISMELLGGRSLASILSAERNLPVRRVLHIMEQVASAVAEAHAFGIVHRDLKPENIQIDRVANDPDFAKVLDFGIAKMVHGEAEGEERSKTITMAGAVFGTPHYMSPEQVHGLRVDPRTDVYSLGIILYELLAGRPPFDGATPMSIMMAQASKAPPDIREAHPELNVPDCVAEIINAALIKDVDRRLSSAAEMVEQIKAARFELADHSLSTSSRLAFDPSQSGLRVSSASVNPLGPTAQAVVLPNDTLPPRGTLNPQLEDALGEIESPSGGASKWLKVGLAGAVTCLGAVLFFVGTQGAPDKPASAPTDAASVPSPAQTIRYMVESHPSGANVAREGKLLGKTPLPMPLPIGERPTLMVTLDGYAPASLAVPGAGDAQQTLFADLVPQGAAQPKTAWFEITSEPSDAEVLWGTQRIGLTPLKWTPPATSEAAELKIVKRGFKTETRTVRLHPSAIGEPLTVPLVPSQGGSFVTPRPGPVTPRPVAPATRAATPATVAPAPPPSTKAPGGSTGYEKL